VGRELDRATTAYLADANRRASYISPQATNRSERRLVLVALGVLAVGVIGAALVMRAKADDATSISAAPDLRAISATLGGPDDGLLWPAGDSGIVLSSAGEVAREFAVRVLRLPEFTIVNESTDGGLHPTVVRIESPTVQLSLMVSPNRSPDRWVLHQINTGTMSQSANALRFERPADAVTAELFVRDDQGHGARLIHFDGGDRSVEVPTRGWVASAIAVFRNSDGAVINARGGAFSPFPQGSTTQRPPVATTMPVASSAPATTAVSASPHPIGELKIVVMNSSQRCGVATNYRPLVMANGYQMVEVVTGPPTTTSFVIYATGYELDAAILAQRLGMLASTSADSSLTDAFNRTGAHLGVVLGVDALRYVAQPETCQGTDDGGSVGVNTTMRPATTRQ
jgi:hypothetical protein